MWIKRTVRYRLSGGGLPANHSSAKTPSCPFKQGLPAGRGTGHGCTVPDRDVSAAVEEILTSIKAEMLNAALFWSRENHTNLEHCRTPNNCPFRPVHPDLPGHSIYEIPRLHRNKALQMEEMGIRDIRNIPADFMLSEKTKRLRRRRAGEPPFHRPGMRAAEIIESVYPLYFLDYETCNPALPSSTAISPTSISSSNFRCTSFPSPQADVEHHQFLHSELSDPAPPCWKSCRTPSSPAGQHLVWNKGFECSRHHDWQRCILLRCFLENVNSRVFDLLRSSAMGCIFIPIFTGSASIKESTSVLVSELSYDEMEIAKGDEASIACGNCERTGHGRRENNHDRQTAAILPNWTHKPC